LILWLDQSSIRGFKSFFSAQLAAASCILDDFAPQSVIVSENGISGPLPLLTMAQERGIVCVTIPYGNGRVVDLEIDQERKRLAGEQIIPMGLYKAILRALLPKWIKRGAHQGAVMFHPPYIFVLEAMGMTLDNPWICHGGPMDLMCVENRTGYDQYVGEGLPPRKLKLTGSPYCDEMMDAIQTDQPALSTLHEPRYINANRPRILVSWPPDYHATHVGKSEFGSYDEMTARYMQFLKSLDSCDITVSLHPDAGDVGRNALHENGIVATGEHLVGLLPKHDVFVTFFSSATRWAIAAGKPIVNIDLYQQEIQNFVHLPSVVHTRNFADFSYALRRVISSQEVFAELAGHQISAAPDYGIMDHQCVSRIMSEIDAVVKGKGQGA
jgi:hypothetical protein